LENQATWTKDLIQCGNSYTFKRSHGNDCIRDQPLKCFSTHKPQSGDVSYEPCNSKLLCTTDCNADKHLTQIGSIGFSWDSGIGAQWLSQFLRSITLEDQWFSICDRRSWEPVIWELTWNVNPHTLSYNLLNQRLGWAPALQNALQFYKPSGCLWCRLSWMQPVLTLWLPFWGVALINLSIHQ
jgi:hypothetical protein